MGLEPSRSLTMSRLALFIYLVLITINWTGAVGQPGHRRIVRHYQPSASSAWPSRIPFRELQRVGRQFQLAASIESSSFIPLGGNIPLEPEHRSIDPVQVNTAPSQIPANDIPVAQPLVQQYQQPVVQQPVVQQPVVQQPAQLPVAQPLIQQQQQPVVQQSGLQGPRPPYGPPVQLATNQENGRQSLSGWSNHNGQEVATTPQVDRRNSYNPSPPTFDSSSSQFSHRSFEMPPSPAQLGFPSVSSTEENWHYDVNWADFTGKRRRRSPQQTAPRRRNPISEQQQDNIALEGRRAAESRVPAPRPAQNERPEREGSAYKQEYDGPYVYTQLFGPPYEVGYIRSPIPSKHVYEDYLQFVRSWSSASRDAVDEQMRKNPSLAKEYESVKYSETTPAYKETPKESYQEPEYKEPAYKPAAQAYKEPEYKEPAYKESVPAYKEPEYKEPAYKEPAPAYKEPVYSEPAYKEPAYKEPEYKEPAYKEPAYKEPAYKEPAYKEPEYKEPAYKEPAYKEPAYKEPAQAYKEPAYKEPAQAYKEPAYKEPVQAYKEPAYKEPEYKEPAYKEPAPAYKEPSYKEPEYKEPAVAYKEPAYKEPAYKEPAYKEPAYKEPAYKEPVKDYKEEVYREQARTEPVFREETYRDSSRKEPAYKETAHKSPAYKEESYPSPSIDYHSPKNDYKAPETEFRPTNRPYAAVGPKTPVLIERDFVPIKQSGPSQQYDNPTTYRTTTAAAYNNYDAPASYEILKPFEKTKQSNAYSAPSYEPPTAVYEPVTAKYKAPIESYDQTAYEAPKRYENPPTRETSKKYESPPSRPSSPSVAYYQPPTRYVEPPQYPSKNGPGYSDSGSKPYETSSARYESPAPAYESPAKYSEPAYEAPKKYETSTRYPEYATTKSYKPDGYRIEPLTTPAYKEPYGSDDYAPSSYKDDVDLSSTSYQAVSQNYDTPKDDYKPPSAYTTKEESYSTGSKDAYLPASYDSDSKKSDDSYKSDAAQPGYEASTSKKKHYPVIIGRYQVTDSSAFLPKKVEGGGSSSGVKTVGSQVHGANGEEYVVYYLPYGQPLPIPVRKRRSAQQDPVYPIRRWKSLADTQVRRGRRLRGQRQPEEQVLSPEEVHKLVKYPVPNNYRTTTIQPVETTDEQVVTDAPQVQETAPVPQEDERSTPNVQEEQSFEAVEEVKEEIVAPEVVQDEVVPVQVEETVPVQLDETIPVQVDEVGPVQQDETVPVQAEEIQQEQLPAIVEQDENQKSELTPTSNADENLPLPVEPETEPVKVHESQADVDDVVVPISPENDEPISVDEIVLAQIEEELKDSLVPVTGDENQDVPESELIEETPIVGEIIVVKEVPIEQEEEPVDVDSFIKETEEHKFTPQFTFPPPAKVSYKKKYPAITESPSVLPGLTQKPVKYIKPPGIATDPKHEWNGYSTWWTKLGNRVAKIYNYE